MFNYQRKQRTEAALKRHVVDPAAKHPTLNDRAKSEQAHAPEYSENLTALTRSGGVALALETL